MINSVERRIKNILIVVNKGQVSQFRKILSNGKRFGVNIDCSNGMLPIKIKQTNHTKKKFNYK